MEKEKVKDILMGYFSKDDNGDYRPSFIADASDEWNEMFQRLFGE